jgi:hypothetical protein
MGPGSCKNFKKEGMNGGGGGRTLCEYILIARLCPELFPDFSGENEGKFNGIKATWAFLKVQ